MNGPGKLSEPATAHLSPTIRRRSLERGTPRRESRQMLTALLIAMVILVPPLVWVWRSYEEPS
jgi:hypothetical protein